MIFFAENGLTSTSANHIANLAKEYVQSLESEVNNVEFYNTFVQLISSSERNQLQEGVSEELLYQIPRKLNRISDANSLIAWLREAIKAREAMLSHINRVSFEDFCKEQGFILPEMPEREDELTEDAYFATLSIKERNHIYTLKSKAAVFGKYIHPDGKFSDARKDLNNKLRHSREVSGEGRDTLLYTYEPSVASDSVEDIFFALQNEHRNVQAELNGIMHKKDEAIRADRMRVTVEYNQRMQTYRDSVAILQDKFNVWKEQESKRIADLKILIPNDLQEIYKEVNVLGK